MPGKHKKKKGKNAYLYMGTKKKKGKIAGY
jgi:hypothetical protein